MHNIQWKSEYSVGVDDIDAQHQRLISIINRLAQTRDEAMTSDELFAILSDLVDYSDYHFRTEDNYMMENEYPLFLSHRKEHLAYMKKMGSMVQSHKNKKPGLFEEMLSYLSQWWQTHITESDLRYARYIQARKKE